MAGYSGTPLARKLGIKEGYLVGVCAAPTHFSGLLDLPSGAQLVETTEEGRYDVMVLFVRDEETLDANLVPLLERLTSSGGLWVAWPKQRSPLATDLKEGHVRAAGLEAGVVDNKICAIDEDWSGLRFVYRVKDRPARDNRG